jgi:hypothetical protein
MNIITRIRKLFTNSNSLDPYSDPWRLPPQEYRVAVKNPYFREALRDLSINEDDENSYYTGILNTVADACVGTVPMVLGNHPDNDINDSIEDKWLEWCVTHNIGHALRECRRDACKTGIGIIVPYTRDNTLYPVRLALRNVSAVDLVNPLVDDPNLDIEDGIEYDTNGDIVAVWIKDTQTSEGAKRYSVPDKAIVWRKPKTTIIPECGPAFCIFPSVRRYMKAIVRGEEFRASMPLAIELDPLVYKRDDTDGVPSGKYEYEPGQVPTLPPGTKFTGIPSGAQSNERTQFIELVIAAAARCKNMPKNIALGDSSNHNMASAQIDIEPWKNTVDIDRFDFEPVPRQVYLLWYGAAQLIEGYLPQKARAAGNSFSYSFNYKRLYTHPDPAKKANARMTDLLSGSTTLYRIHTEEGRNPRRELDKEAQLLGITRDELNKMYLGIRDFKTLQALKLLPEDSDGDSERTPATANARR